MANGKAIYWAFYSGFAFEAERPLTDEERLYTYGLYFSLLCPYTVSDYALAYISEAERTLDKIIVLFRTRQTHTSMYANLLLIYNMFHSRRCSIIVPI